MTSDDIFIESVRVSRLLLDVIEKELLRGKDNAVAAALAMTTLDHLAFAIIEVVSVLYREDPKKLLDKHAKHVAKTLDHFAKDDMLEDLLAKAFSQIEKAMEKATLHERVCETCGADFAVLTTEGAPPPGNVCPLCRMNPPPPRPAGATVQ